MLKGAKGIRDRPSYSFTESCVVNQWVPGFLEKNRIRTPYRSARLPPFDFPLKHLHISRSESTAMESNVHDIINMG